MAELSFGPPPGLREGTKAEVLVIVEAMSKYKPSFKARRSNLHESIAAYAAAHAGTDADLDPVLEAAATEFLSDEPEGRRR